MISVEEYVNSRNINSFDNGYLDDFADTVYQYQLKQISFSYLKDYMLVSNRYVVSGISSANSRAFLKTMQQGVVWESPTV